MALDIGRKVTGTHVNVWSTFRNLPMLHHMLRYLGFTLNGKYYINTLLPFGATSSCLILKKVPSLIEWIVCNETSRKYMSYYLDNFPLPGSSAEDTQCFIEEFTDILLRIHELHEPFPRLVLS